MSDQDEIQDDTEGHGRRAPLAPTEPGDLVDDDTEGHVYLPEKGERDREVDKG